MDFFSDFFLFINYKFKAHFHSVRKNMRYGVDKIMSMNMFVENFVEILFRVDNGNFFLCIIFREIMFLEKKF